MTIARIGKLDLVLLAGVVLLTGYLMLMAVNNTTSPLVITRGTSMEPTYHEGDLLTLRRVAPVDIAVGDVIVFDISGDAKSANLPDLVAHRITKITARGGKFVYHTQGDNSDPDPFTVESSQVRGVVIGNLGPIGRLFLIRFNLQSLALLFVPVGVFVGFLWLASSWLKESQSKASSRSKNVSEASE